MANGYEGQSYGTPTDLLSLDVGTAFYVVNGAWYGEIVEKDGCKAVYVQVTKKTHPITEGNRYSLVLQVEQADAGEGGEILCL